jgi:hypothetical protein
MEWSIFAIARRPDAVQRSNETQRAVTIASLLSILFLTFHLADDIIRALLAIVEFFSSIARIAAVF